MSAALELLKEAALKLEEARKSGDQKAIAEATIEHRLALRKYGNDMELQNIAPVIVDKIKKGQL